MDEHRIRKILEGGGGWPGRLARTLLWLPGQAYGLAMRLRRAAYAAGWLESHEAARPVVGIGNLTVGGSGKTPFTALLATEIAASGNRVGVLLRGYRPTAEGESDEALLYRRLCPGALVEVGADRLASAGRAIGRGAEVLFLDDGFQHLRLRRQLDIVLVDALSSWGGGVPIPGGLLREPPTALSRAGAVVVTRSDQVSPGKVAAIKRDIARLAPMAAVFTATHQPQRLYASGAGAIPMESLRGRRVVAVAGIARPEAFARTLASLGAEVVEAMDAPDHADFSPGFIETAFGAAAKAGAAVVITEKDAVKKPFSGMLAAEPADNMTVPLWALGVAMRVEALPELLRIVRSAAGLR